MKKEIERYKKWLKRRERILELIDNHPCESWIKDIKNVLAKYSKDLSKTGQPWSVDSVYFCERKEDCFDVYWIYPYNGHACQTLDVPISFFDDPEKYCKQLREEKKKETEHAKNLAEKAEYRKYLSLKAKFENRPPPAL